MATVGIYIPQDSKLPIYRDRYNGIGDYRRAVHGLVDTIALDTPQMMLIVNTGWRYPRSAINERATQLVWLHNPLLRMQALIGGDVVLVGPPTEDDEIEDVPEDFARFILSKKTYEVEHRTVGGLNWPVHRRSFDDYFSAAIYSVDLIWTARQPTETRIIAGTEATS